MCQKEFLTVQCICETIKNFGVGSCALHALMLQFHLYSSMCFIHTVSCQYHCISIKCSILLSKEGVIAKQLSEGVKQNLILCDMAAVLSRINQFYRHSLLLSDFMFAVFQFCCIFANEVTEL